MGLEVENSGLDEAYDALQSERWDEAETLARAALGTALTARDEEDAALARFLLGTALVGPDGATREARLEACEHLEVSAPLFEQREEHELAGEAWSLLAGVALVEARDHGDPGDLEQAGAWYRRSVECFGRTEAAESNAAALHNLGLCLAARSSDESLTDPVRATYLDDALTCFHDALEIEIECGLSLLAEATEHEREQAQLLRDAIRRV